MPEKITDVMFSDGLIDSDKLTDNSYLRCQFSNCTFEGDHANVEFIECEFGGCSFEGAFLNSCIFNYCHIVDIDFKETNLDHSTFIRCEFGSSVFEECSLYGVRFERSNVDSVSFVNSDAQFCYFSLKKDELYVGGIEFINTDLSDADLSQLRGLTYDQLRSAFGNPRTLLPDGVKRPDSWFEEDAEPPEIEGIPGQQAAPLRVVWRDRRLAPDPRGGVQDQFGNPALMTLYRALADDFRKFLESTPTNHPVIDRIRAIHLLLARGPTSLNPTELGYNLEVLRAQLSTSGDELTSETTAAISGLVSGGYLLVGQFDEWRDLAIAADFVEGKGSISDLANAIRMLARATVTSSALFERRIGESLSAQAEDIIGFQRIRR